MAAAQKLQPSLEEIFKLAKVVESKIDLLINAAKEGGGLVPQVDYKELRKIRKKVRGKTKIKCKKQCKKGPCRYGAAQAVRCYEQFEKMLKIMKKRRLLAEHIPYSKSQLHEMRRKDLLMIAGLMSVNVRKVLKIKGQGNAPFIEAILATQPRYLRIVEKLEKRKNKKPKEKHKKKKELPSTSGILEV